jgi:hypothetical protein
MSIVVHCSEDKLSPICHSKLMHDAPNVDLNGGLRQAELTRNSLIRMALSEKTEHILLLGCKVCGVDYSVESHFAIAAGQNGGGKK